MPDVELTESQRATLRRLRRRRLSAVAWALVAGAVLLWLVMAIPHSRYGGLAKYTTSYGAIRWTEVVSPAEQGGIAAVLPVGTVGLQRIYPVRLVISCALCGAIVWVIVLCVRRELRNLSPRWRCQWCGHVVGAGHPRTNECPECGALPNLKCESWAFWQQAP